MSPFFIRRLFMKFKKKDKEEKEKRKKEGKKKDIRSCLDIIPIREYDDSLETFKLENGRYMDIRKIIPRDLGNMSEDEKQIERMNLNKVFKTVEIDMKFVSMNFPLNTNKQKSVLLEYRKKARDEVRIKWIDRQIRELELCDSNINTRNFYLFFFADNEKEFIKNKELLEKYTAAGTVRLTTEITKNEKIQIVTKFNNMNTTIDLMDEAMKEDDKYTVEKKEDEDILDENLFTVIQPKGGITFKEPSYITSGDGYIRCLHLYELPNTINFYWIAKLFSVPGSICVFDVSSKDMNEVKKNINRSITEEYSRGAHAKDYMDLYDAEKRRKELQDLYDDLTRMGEVIKLCDFRMFVKAKTKEELEERCSEIFKNLEAEGYRTTTLLNEQKTEFCSLYESYREAHKKPFMMRGLNLTSEQLGNGFPFNYSELLDPEASLLGFSNAGGAVLFDEFTKTAKRKHYNAIVCGDMGSGKSTHLKKRLKHHASIGNFIRVFDVSGEFTPLVQEFGGKVIKCNGLDGILNPLEILRSGEDEFTSYSNHLAKLKSFFKCIIPSMADDLMQELANQLRELYGIFDLLPDNGNIITGKEPSEYPTLSDFRVYLAKALAIVNDMDKVSKTGVEKSLNVGKAKYINDILRAVDMLINNYGNMFDGYTAIVDITNEKIVSFDISDIKDLGEVFTAQMQNIVSLCWDNAISNGTVMKKRWESGTVRSEDITKFIILIDESHRWVNTSMPLILDMIIRYMREARKYFAGIILASQSIRDFMPEASDKDLEKIRILFEHSQYKFMFKQDSAAKEHIRKIFGNGMTYSQIESIPFLEAGETVLSIAGDRSIAFKEWLSKDYEEQLFSGGR